MKFYTSAIAGKTQILLRGYENGRAFSRKQPYEPTLFVKGDEKSVWKTIYGHPVEPMVFPDMREANDFLKRYDGVSNFTIHGLPKFVYTFLNEEYPGAIEFDPALIRIANIDIEVSSKNGFPAVATASEEITAITVKKDDIFYVFGYGNFTTERTDIKYVKCRDEKHLLLSFIEEWSRGGYPDIVTGWNIAFFDIPYLTNRITNVLDKQTACQLSPWKYLIDSTPRKVNANAAAWGDKQISVSLAGISTLDYMELYKKFTYSQQESYRLDNIAFVELGDRKLDYSEYDTLHGLYEQNYQKFIEYNIHDVEIIDRLEDKMKLIDMVLTLAYDAKVNMNDVFTQVRMWDTLIHNELWKEKIVVPSSSYSVKDDQYEGAYVKAPQIGMHEWVMSFDLTSLYPSLIMQYNISPETISNKKIEITVNDLLNKNKEVPLIKDHSLAPNGWYFSNKKQGFLPRMMQRMYDDRAIYKKKMIEAQKMYEKEDNAKRKNDLSKLISRYKNLQLAKKVQLNSAYGAIGNAFFRFFDLRQATAITLGGQLAIRWAENEINSYMNTLLKTEDKDYVIAGDTDSIFINFSPLVYSVFENAKDIPTDKIISFLDDVSKKKIEPFIDNLYKSLAIRTQAFEQKMIMKREIIANRAIWTAKKRYILNTCDAEGVRYAKPKLKITGIEAVKSSTPLSCRDAIKESLTIIMNSDEESIQNYIKEFKKKFKTLSFEDIAFPRGLQNLATYEKERKGVPIHVRGAISYNKLLRDYKLTKKYETIKEGDKVKFCYMKVPNTIQQNVFSIAHRLPREFDLTKYIDYDLQFEKAFMQPLQAILDVIHWSPEKRSTIEDFFQ